MYQLSLQADLSKYVQNACSSKRFIHNSTVDTCMYRQTAICTGFSMHGFSVYITCMNCTKTVNLQLYKNYVHVLCKIIIYIKHAVKCMRAMCQPDGFFEVSFLLLYSYTSIIRPPILPTPRLPTPNRPKRIVPKFKTPILLTPHLSEPTALLAGENAFQQ